MNEPLDPNKTMLVCKHRGREVGRIPATARNAQSYMHELTRFYGELQVDYEINPDAGLLAPLHQPIR